jgi:hypothetical protein
MIPRDSVSDFVFLNSGIPRRILYGGKLVSRYHYQETPINALELAMPPIFKEMIGCSVYVFSSRKDAEKGSGSGGSGFLISVRLKENEKYGQIFVVTSEHVVRGEKNPAIRYNTKQGSVDIVESKNKNWLKHPTFDIAVLPYTAPENQDWTSIPGEMILTEQEAYEKDISPGDEAFIIGRFFEDEGTERNNPIVRFASIAMMPEGFPDQEWSEGRDLILIECRSIGLFSGGPVFVWRAPFGSRKQQTFAPTPIEGPWLLGINRGHLPILERVYKDVGNKKVKTEFSLGANSAIAGVVPAWYLFDLLNKEEFVMKRKRDDEKISEERRQASSQSMILDKGEPAVFTKDKFLDALRKSSRRTSPSKSEPEKKGG